MKCEKCGEDMIYVHSYDRGLHERLVYRCANGHTEIKTGKLIKTYWQRRKK